MTRDLDKAIHDVVRFLDEAAAYFADRNIARIEPGATVIAEAAKIHREALLKAYDEQKAEDRRGLPQGLY